MGVAVLVVLAVRFVVLVAVRNEIGEGETVVRCDEVDRSGRLAPTPVEEVGRRRQASCKLGELAFITFPEGADRIAEAVVPFSPARWKTTDLIPPRPAIPRL